MTALPTPREVALQLAEIGRALDTKTLEIAALDEEATRKKAAYQVSYARAFLNATGSVDARKQLAVMATEVEHLESELAEVKLRAAKEAIRTMRDRLDIGRSLNAAVRSEWEASGVTPVNLENIIREEAERRAGIEAPTVLETVVVVGLLVLAFAFVVWAVVVTS